MKRFLLALFLIKIESHTCIVPGCHTKASSCCSSCPIWSCKLQWYAVQGAIAMVEGAITMKQGARWNWCNGGRCNYNETRRKVQLEQWCKVQLQRNKVQGAIKAMVQGAIEKKQGARCYWSNGTRCTVQLQWNMVKGAIGAMVQGEIAMKQGARCNWSNGARCNWK